MSLKDRWRKWMEWEEEQFDDLRNRRRYWKLKEKTEDRNDYLSIEHKEKYSWGSRRVDYTSPLNCLDVLSLVCGQVDMRPAAGWQTLDIQWEVVPGKIQHCYQ